MFALINKLSRKIERNNKSEEESDTKPVFVIPKRIDDEELKRRIAEKLQTYQPQNRESSFGNR